MIPSDCQRSVSGSVWQVLVVPSAFPWIPDSSPPPEVVPLAPLLHMGRLNAVPEDHQVLFTFELVTMSLYVKRSLAGWMKRRILRYGDSFGFSNWAEHNHEAPCQRDTRRSEEKEGDLVTEQEVGVREEGSCNREHSHRS